MKTYNFEMCKDGRGNIVEAMDEWGEYCKASDLRDALILADDFKERANVILESREKMKRKVNLLQEKLDRIERELK